MAKKEKTVESVGNFDILSNESYVASMTNTTSSNAVDDKTLGIEKTEDAEADKILANVAKQEAKAKKDTPDTSEKEEEEKEQEQEEETEEEKEEEKEEEVPEGKEKAPGKDDKKEEEKDKEKEAETDDTAELTFDNDKVAESVTEENGWRDVAKELDIELESDDFEELKTKLAEKTEYSLAKFKPETQRLIKFTEAGGSMNDFLEPLSKVDAALMLPTADLVDRHLEAKGWNDPAKRQAELERMVESGEADVIAKEARGTLTSYRTEVMNSIIDERVKAQEKFDQRAANAPKAEAKAIKAQLEATKEFMGTKLKPENIDKIVKNYESGKYHDAMKDSKEVAEFALWKEFGKMGITNLKTQAQREFKEKHKELFHKVPPKNQAAAGTIRKAKSSGQAPEGDWDLLEKEKV